MLFALRLRNINGATDKTIEEPVTRVHFCSGNMKEYYEYYSQGVLRDVKFGK